MIRIRCPRCGKTYKVPESYAGRQAQCGNCRQVMRVGEDLSTWLEALEHAMKEWGQAPAKAESSA